MKKPVLFLFFILVSVFYLNAKTWRSSVALVIDRETYQNVKSDIDSYAAEIEKTGKNAIIVEDKWQHPDSIRLFLMQLYVENNLEGAVLIGNIPIPMIRDAQHLCTAFKMDQSRDWKESSVPSDRFYDDFDLKFDYLKQDEDISAYHYYSLRPDSPQYISCDIYSARIKVPVIPGGDTYDAMSQYLKKIVKEKSAKKNITNVFHYAGHGYNSESLQARVDEAWVLRHHFRTLDTNPEARLRFINFDRDSFVKNRLMSALADPDMDIAILHHHGSDDAQYLSKTPYTYSASEYLEYARMFFRSKIRRSRDTLASKEYYISEYRIPKDWVEGAFDPKITDKDEEFSKQQEIITEDLYGYSSGPKFLMLDACFNGSFHLEDYIAGHYIFNPGGTIAVKANSVNTLQDIWSTELIGLLDAGVCVGNWVKNVVTLEAHLLGDPTFAFNTAYGKIDIDRDIVKERDNRSYWRRLLNKDISPDINVLSMAMLMRNHAITPHELISIMRNDNNPIMRMGAFALLRKQAGPELTEALVIGLNDSYELLTRLSAFVAGKSGDPALLPVIVGLYCNPETPARVVFQLRSGLEQYPAEEVREAFEKVRRVNSPWPTDKNYEELIAGLRRSEKSSGEELESLSDEEIPYRKRRLLVTSDRNKCTTDHLDKFFTYLQEGQNDELRLTIAEALGWYVYSYEKANIADLLRGRIAVEQNPGIRAEMEKSLNRLYPL